MRRGSLRAGGAPDTGSGSATARRRGSMSGSGSGDGGRPASPASPLASTALPGRPPPSSSSSASSGASEHGMNEEDALGGNEDADDLFAFRCAPLCRRLEREREKAREKERRQRKKIQCARAGETRKFTDQEF